MTCKLCVPRTLPIVVNGIDYICVEHLDRDDFDEDSFEPATTTKNGQQYPHIVLYGYIKGEKKVWKMYHPLDDWNSEHALNSSLEVPLINKIIESININ